MTVYGRGVREITPKIFHDLSFLAGGKEYVSELS